MGYIMQGLSKVMDQEVRTLDLDPGVLEETMLESREKIMSLMGEAANNYSVAKLFVKKDPSRAIRFSMRAFSLAIDALHIAQAVKGMSPDPQFAIISKVPDNPTKEEAMKIFSEVKEHLDDVVERVQELGFIPTREDYARQ